MVKILPAGIIKSLHSIDVCDGPPCVIHSPSNHKMNTWTINIRSDKLALAERLCPHGIGHPDPDSLAWLAKQGWADRWIGIHGCDGCCRND